MKKQKGFSLIELLIVVAIILIIAAIAIPNLIRSKMAANEASAVASLRTINTAEVTYNNTYPGLFGSLAQIGPADATCSAGPVVGHACLIDFLLSQGTKSGYTFVATGSALNVGTFTNSAVPVTQGSTGTRSFCSDQNLVLYYISTGGACTVATATAPL
ncbi:MAG: prepilin-type N-terminal cleavage/methylation domain-containing protein [Candidatus Acidiferrales bacterium]